MGSTLPPVSVAVSWDAGQAVIAISGDLDYLTAPYAVARVGEVLDRQPGRLILDLAGLDFLDSYGLHVMRVIIRARHTVPRQDRLILRSPTPRVRQVLQITGMDRACIIDDSPRPAPPAG
jgi:anti-anti-sigma factor